jgi:phosphate transport system permease protein
VTLEPTATVGALPALAVSAVLLFVARATTTQEPETRAERLVARGARLVVAGLVAGALVEVFVAEIGVPGVPFMPIAVGGVAFISAVAFVASYVRDVPYPRVLPVTLLLWASVVACVHVLATGNAVAVAGVGIVQGGTVNWPFLMNPSQGLGIQIGVMPAMFGTIWIVLGAVVFAVPLAVGAAVYLTEYAEDSIFTRGVDVATNGLWSTPSIVFGLFGLAFIVPRFGGGPSILASQLVLGFMLLPLVLITSREAMKSVPDEYRDASAALGVSKWQTIRSVVVPAAMPGVITGVILGVGRIAGETAPLLLVLNGPNFPGSAPGVLTSFEVGFGLQPPFVHVSNPALLERASALPYQLYAVITAGVGAEEAFGWGTALVLLGVVLSFFAVSVASRRYFRRKLQQ